jgi:UNC-50 family
MSMGRKYIVSCCVSAFLCEHPQELHRDLCRSGQYVYGTYLGMSSLPFLIRTELLLFPLLPLFCSYIVSLLGFNVAKMFLSVYFG